ncbi:hypothetical protein Tco_0817501 [Tanacetum coccineum]
MWNNLGLRSQNPLQLHRLQFLLLLINHLLVLHQSPFIDTPPATPPHSPKVSLHPDVTHDTSVDPPVAPTPSFATPVSRSSRPRTRSQSSDAVIPTGLGDVNALYFTDKSSKYFTHLREILHLIDRQDLSKLYGMVSGLSTVWKLVSIFCSSVLETSTGKNLYMFADTPYPLSASLMKKMLQHKLEVEIDGIGNDMTYTVQLIQFIKNTLGFIVFPPMHYSLVASPEQTATGKDKSNLFLAVMTCQKSYSSSTYYDSCSESGKWFQSSMDLTLSGSINLDAAVFVAVSILKALKTEDLSRKLEVNYIKFQFRGGLLGDNSNAYPLGGKTLREVKVVYEWLNDLLPSS